jgi:hypothetical protein
MEGLLKWVPIIVLAAGVVGSASVAQFQIKALAQQAVDLEADLEDSENTIRLLRETDIRTEGQLKLEVQKLNSNIANQSAKIDQLLFLLQNRLPE